MATNDKFKPVFDAVLNIPIVEGFEHYGFPSTPCGNVYQLPSPFRQDSGKTSFTLNPNLNIYKDWVVLENRGNLINFISSLSEIREVSGYKNLDYFHACMVIAKDFGIIDDNTFKSVMSSSKKVSSVSIKPYAAINPVKKVVNRIAPPETLDKVFRIFIGCCTLSETHKKHLMEKRMLSEEEILLNMFFTFPTRAVKTKFLKEIENEFGSQDVLKTIPGFYKRKSEKDFTFKHYKGIGIPIFNEVRQIIGIQIRLDGEKVNPRYFWFSSSSTKEDEEFGTSSGSPIDVCYPSELKYKGIFITEGKFKALKLAKEFGCVSISVQGVSTWKPIIPLLKRICDSVNAKYPKFKNEWRIQMIYSAFDADMCENYGVYKQLQKMTDEIRKDTATEVRGAKFNVKYLHWDVTIGKGIDDLINVSDEKTLSNRLHICNKDDYDEAYSKVIEECIKGENLQNESQIASKVSSEKFLEYYQTYFKIGD